MKRKVKEALNLVITLCLFAILAYLAAAVSLGTLVIYNKLVGQ